MKKTIAAAVLALVLAAGGISSVSAKGFGKGMMDGTGTGVCTQEDCPNDGVRPMDGTGQKSGGGGGFMMRNMDDAERQEFRNKVQNMDDAERAAFRDEMRQKFGGGGGQQGQAQGQGLRDGSCGTCVNDGVRPMDGSGQKKGQ